MKKLHNLVMVLALLVAGNLYAGPVKDYYPSETWAGARIVYNFAVMGLDEYTLRTTAEPVVCWPFPLEFEVFYRTLQDAVNADIEAWYPSRDRGKLAATMGWRVFNLAQQEFGCGP